MTLADNENRPDAQETARPVQLQGRVDAVENDRVFGWVWDAGNPKDRITVQIHLDGRRLSSGVADRPRIDLRRNGIGDGAHAFDLELPQEARAALDGISVLAVSPIDGTDLVLRRPSDDEKAAEAAIAAPLARVLDKLDRLLAAQRQIAVGQRDATNMLKDTIGRLDALASTEGELGEALGLLRGGQSDLARRISDIEVFLMRFDGTLHGFDDRLIALGDRSRHGPRVQFLVLAAMAGVVAGLLIALVVGL